jgi:hypothetical protein
MQVLLQTLLGGLLVIVGSILGSRINIKATNQIWLSSQLAEHNRGTAQRLTRLYAPLVQSTATIQSVAYERKYLTTQDVTEEARDARHVKMLNKAHQVVEELGGELLIDSDARPLREMYNVFRRTFDRFIVESTSTVASADRASKVEAIQQELGKQAIAIQDAAEAQLAELNKTPTLDNTEGRNAIPIKFSFSREKVQRS